MRLKRLELKNIGPFKTGELDFISSKVELEHPPVIIITGENSTGKTIILDAIRALFMGIFNATERDIIASEDFMIKLNLEINNKPWDFYSNKYFNTNQKSLQTNNNEICKLFYSHLATGLKRDFVFDYWTSNLSNDDFELESISLLKPDSQLDNSLKGIHKNIDTAKTIIFFDYLKDSKDSYEKHLGNEIYKILESIINISIDGGYLSHVSRTTLNPMINIMNRDISLEKLSSGNRYLIQRLLSLLKQVYSICITNNIKIDDYKSIKGLLLIDEIENHLHPKWQKVILKNILEIFPNLQIIVTTHSPFIVSSIENSKVFVCESELDYSIIKEYTDYYANKPIEEILLSPLFDTSSFNNEITALMKERKIAISNNNNIKASEIEQKLLDINPQYFNYLKIEELIKSIKK